MSTTESALHALANQLLDSALSVEHIRTVKQRSVVITLESKLKVTMYYSSEFAMTPMMDGVLRLAAFSFIYQHRKQVIPLWDDQVLAYGVCRFFADKAVQIQQVAYKAGDLENMLACSNTITAVVMKYELGNAVLTLKVDYSTAPLEEVQKHYPKADTPAKETIDVSAIDAVDPALAELLRGLRDATKH